MSRRNRENRAATLRERRRTAAGDGPAWVRAGPDRAATREMHVAALLAAARSCRHGDGDVVRRQVTALVAHGGADRRDLDLAVDLAVATAIGAAWRAGWLPADLYELARRRCALPLVDYLADAVVIESARYAPATLHPRWRAMLAAVPGRSAPAPESHLRHWAGRHELDRTAAVAAVVEVLALLGSVPVLERLLPLPGESRHTVAASGSPGDVDEKALAKVRALLAKAESTEFPDEAEALSAKAQELMSRYSLHQALLDHDRGRAPAAAGRRLWMDAPYPGAKALLVQVVATANRCRAVWSEKLGFVTVVGSETELDIVELLVTSLLVQASRAMLAAGRQVSRAGTSRTRSFRQSFLAAYATRIGERLDAASTAGTAAEARSDSRLLPVLAARSRAVEELTERLFPAMVHRAVPVSNAAGWGAGRAAADLALIDVRGSIAG